MDSENKEKMKKVLTMIQDGTFNAEWISQYQKNGKDYSPSADADGGDANSGGSRGSQRRSLRDDGYDSNGDDERPRFS